MSDTVELQDLRDRIKRLTDDNTALRKHIDKLEGEKSILENKAKDAEERAKRSAEQYIRANQERELTKQKIAQLMKGNKLCMDIIENLSKRERSHEAGRN